MLETFTALNFIEMPWKNGGGKTLELYRLDDLSTGAFKLRISIADVEQSGPFSLFPGIERILLLLKGNGFRLLSHARDQPLTTLLYPLNFPGEEAIECSLINGPCRDFNVMIDRNFGKAALDIGEIKGLINAKMDLLFLYDLDNQTLYKLEHNDTLDLGLKERFFIKIEIEYIKTK